MSWLDRIREKDDHSKKRIAFWISLIITLIIVSVWAFNLPYIFKQTEEKNQIASPTRAIWNRIENIFDFGPEVYKAE